MKYSLILATFLMLFSATIFAEKESCHEIANTQFDMNVCANSDFERADKELNEVYNKILKRYHNSPQFLKNLRAAQHAWLVFRDAHLKMIFPLEKDPKTNYGSVFPMCWATIKAGITFERAKELRRWLEPFEEEGNVCQGSIGNFNEYGEK